MDLHHILLHLLIFFFYCSSSTVDPTSFIHKDCANQSFQDPLASQNLQSVFETLVSESSTIMGCKITTSGNLSECDTCVSVVSGAYQCSGSLSETECHTCVKELLNTYQEVCSPNTVAVQVSLRGCYIKYMALGWSHPPAFTKCGSRIPGFEERVEAALSLLTKGVANGNRFYLGEYQSFFLVAQCDVDVRHQDCVKCVASAVEISKRECKSSISSSIAVGRRCLISYNYSGYGADVGSWGRGEYPEDVAFL